VAERHGCLLVKLQHGVVGMPDRVLVRPMTDDVYIEFKRGREQPTKIQAYWHGRLRGMGKRVAVIRSAAQFYSWLTPATEPV
jgi:hypothetical protein